LEPKVEKSSILKSSRNGGRQKGTPNKKTENYLEVLGNHNIEPADLLCYVYNGDYKALKLPEKTFRVGFGGQEFEEYTISLEMRIDAAKNLMSYKYPKRKAIEHTVEKGSTGIILSYSEESLKKAAASDEKK
jgi:hypothetical protein